MAESMFPQESGGSSVATPGGNDTDVQFNDGGALGGASGMTYQKASNALNLNGPLTLTPLTDITASTVRASAAPGTAHIAQWQDASNNILSYIDHAGKFVGDGSLLTNLPGGSTDYAAVVHNGATSYFATLTLAKAAAVSGDCIYVAPGTYNENNLAKHGVNWWFAPGANVTYTSGGTADCGIFDDGASGANGAASFTVGGHGTFTDSAAAANGSTGGVLRLVNTSNVNFTGEALASTGTTVYVNDTNWSSTVYVTARYVTASGVGGQTVRQDGGKDLFVTADHIYNSSYGPTVWAGGANALTKLHVRARRITCYAGKAVQTDSVGNLEMVVDEDIWAGYSDGVADQGSGTTYIKASRIETVGTTSSCGYFTNGTGTRVIDCPLITTAASGVWAFLHDTTGRVTLINSRCVNTGSGGIAAKLFSGPLEVRGSCAFVSATSGATDSITADSARSMYVYGFACGNKALNAHITPLVGSVVFDDANVT